MKWLLYSLILLFSNALVAQEIQPILNFAPNGFFIEITKQIPQNGYYQILRKENSAIEFQQIAVIAPPVNFEDFYNRLILSNAKNPIYDLPTNYFLTKIWNIIIKTHNLDSIPIYGAMPYFQEALGTGYYDNTLTINHLYTYKIQFYANNKLISETTTEPLIFKKSTAVCKIHSASAIANENYIKLNFASSKTNKPFKVKVFRNIYLQTDFIEISPDIIYNNSNDSVFARILDTNVVKGIIYDYFVLPFDELGNEGQNSDTIRVINSFNKSESFIQTIRTKSIDSISAIQISWTCPIPKYLRSINIYRSENYDGQYKLIGSAIPSDTSFIDNQINPIQTYFYYLIINDVFGQSVRSARTTGMLNANKKALSPLDLKAIPENGFVTLTWKRPSADTRGYYIFRSTNLPNDTLTQISDIILNNDLNVKFIDSLKGVTSQVLSYAVKSSNTSYDISNLSEIVYIDNPQNIHLPTPMNLSAKFQDGNVLLIWDINDIENIDIFGYRIFRKLLKKDGSDSTDFIEIKRPNTEQSLNYFTDSSCTNGNTYLYSVQAISANNSQSHLSAPAQIYIPKFKPLSISSCQITKEQDGFYLQWEPTLQDDIKSYKIYRIENNEKYVLIAEINSKQTNYFDKYKSNAPIVFYTITCINNQNIESDITEWFKSEQ
jgi:fibronectin type 3 domain-containing protein